MIQQTLFGETDTGRPLASRMRPRTLEEFEGQRHLLGEGKVLRQLIDGDRVPSMVFWGPPGVGKTTLARIIANRTKANFIDFSAVTSGIKEIKEVMQTAEANRRFGEQTILFVDEIHRFNKAQQDAFLPFVEKGSIILIGATTENPSFEINSALLSRCKVFVLHGLSAGELTELLRRALTDPRGFGGRRVELAEGMLEMIANFANGDARTALNTLEMVVLNGDILPDGSTVVPMETLEQCISKKSLLYDKHGEEHYNLISALHKSMRNSDPDAAVYWLARMLEAGEDVLACRDPLRPAEIAHLLIPARGLAFVTTGEGVRYEGKPYRRLRVDAMAEEKLTRAEKAHLRFIRRVRRALEEEAVASLKRAKRGHDALEALYRPCVDFDAVGALCDAEIARIGAYPV